MSGGLKQSGVRGGRGNPAENESGSGGFAMNGGATLRDEVAGWVSLAAFLSMALATALLSG